jgi:levansucrase
VKAVNDDLSEFELQPPLLEAMDVNQQLEHPYVIEKGGKYYLFTISHEFTFAPGLWGPDGLYGFVADSLDGDYKPLNGDGLVVSNPENNPYQAYS